VFVAILALAAPPLANAQTRLGILYLNQGENWPASSMIYGDYAYFTTNYYDGTNYHGSLVKIDLATFTLVGSLALELQQAGYEPWTGRATAAALDSANGMAYIAVEDKIARVRLSQFDITGWLDVDYGGLYAALIPPATTGTPEYVFFGTCRYPPVEADPAKIVKIRLSDFTISGVLTLNPGEAALCGPAIYEWPGYGYFAFTSGAGWFGQYGPHGVVKVDLNALTRVGALTWAVEIGPADTATTDYWTGCSYWGTQGGRVVSTAGLQYGSALTLDPDERMLRGMIIYKVGGGYAFFATTGPYADKSKIVMIKLSGGTIHGCPTKRVDALTLNIGEKYLWTAVGPYPPPSLFWPSFAYFGGGTEPGFVLKIGLERGGLDQLSTTILNAPANTIYFARTGNIYDDSALGYIYTACTNRPQNIIAQTDPTKVDQATGRPLFTGNMVVFGGWGASKIVNYYEKTLGYTRVSITVDENYFRFWRGSTLVYEVARSTYDYNKADYFVVQIYSDFSSAEPRTVASMWGIAHTGTYASGVYFADYIYPNLASLTEGYYICKWTDLNNDGIQQSNEITIVASGS